MAGHSYNTATSPHNFSAITAKTYSASRIGAAKSASLPRLAEVSEAVFVLIGHIQLFYGHGRDRYIDSFHIFIVIERSTPLYMGQKSFFSLIEPRHRRGSR